MRDAVTSTKSAAAALMDEVRRKVKSVYTKQKKDARAESSLSIHQEDPAIVTSEDAVDVTEQSVPPVEPVSPTKAARDKFLWDLCSPEVTVENKTPRKRKPSFKTRPVEALDAARHNSSRRTAGGRPVVRVKVSHVRAAVERIEGRARSKEAPVKSTVPKVVKECAKELASISEVGDAATVARSGQVTTRLKEYPKIAPKNVGNEKLGVRSVSRESNNEESSTKSSVVLERKPEIEKDSEKEGNSEKQNNLPTETRPIVDSHLESTKDSQINAANTKPESRRSEWLNLRLWGMKSEPKLPKPSLVTYTTGVPTVYTEEPSSLPANKSSLFSDRLFGRTSDYDYAQGTASLVSEEVADDSEYEIVDTGRQVPRANVSFLWGSVVHEMVQQDIELTSDQEDAVYDDVHPPSVQHYDSLENIYDDIGNVQEEEDKREEDGPDDGALLDYEYVSSSGRGDNIYASLSREPETVSNCYESISLYALNSDAVSRNNSLYGAAGAVSTDEMTSSGPSRSDTSDEWVDLELSDSETRSKPHLLLPERPRAHVGRSPSWSQRVRRQWTSRTPRQPKTDTSGSDSDAHHYEVLYELNEQRSSELPIDDFDSGNSDDELDVQPPYNGRLPEPPPQQNIYGISKMAEAAGNKLSQLRKSLSRIRVKRHTTEVRLQDSALSLPPPTSPPAPPTEGGGRLEPGNRKYWSLRKFKRSRSVQSSTFYLTEALDVDAKSSSDSVPDRVSESTTSSEPVQPIRTRSKSNATRPTSPPPLPPDAPQRPDRRDKRSSSSWYAECGVFDSAAGKPLSCPLDNSWYADVGLWEADQPDPPESSPPPSSSASSTSDARFADEPLYQFYAASVVALSRLDDEEVATSPPVAQQRPSAMQLVATQRRTLWCEIPEVLASGVLDSLSARQKKLQEARFEVLASQASYVKSLGVLVEHFVESPQLTDTDVLCKSDARILFGNVSAVRQCARRLLTRMEQSWQRSFLLADICDVIEDHAARHYAIYVKYCSNQIYLDRTLRRLKLEQGRFCEALTALESHPSCESLSLHSFLMLPMQRVTRLPLLLDAVLSRIDDCDGEEYAACARALRRIYQVVKECNEGARRMERMEEMLILSRQLHFPRSLRPVAVISSDRWLVRSGEMTRVSWRGAEERVTFGRRLVKQRVHVFLFTDLLLVAKKKSEEMYTVLDYCARNLIQLTSIESASSHPVKALSEAGHSPMLLTLLSNHDGKTVEMVVCCRLESDRQRWLSAVAQPASENPDEAVYERWDCPQVTATHAFIAAQPDELSMDDGDVVNVLRKLADGWYYGERIRDGETGWFPANHTREVASAHVRARNLKQRYRLLALSGNFLEAQQRQKTK